MWYNECMVISKADQRGGARPGAGRPDRYEVALANAQALVSVLNEYARIGLKELGENFPLLVSEEIRDALDPDTPLPHRARARRFLIEMFMHVARVRDDNENPLLEVMKSWSNPTFVQVQGDLKVQDVAGTGKGHTLDVEGRVVS